MNETDKRASAAVLISGSGSNLQSLIDASERGDIALRIAIVISNNRQAKGLERAHNAGIPTACIENNAFADRQSFDQALAETIDSHAPAMLLLAGFMRILTPPFVNRYRGRILNIHPSLLPAYPGLDTHQRVIDNKEAWHGCTVHFVSEELDGGPTIIQGRVPVEADDTATTLATKVLQVEHRIYPIAANLLGLGRIRCENEQIYLDERVLPEPIVYRQESKPI